MPEDGRVDEFTGRIRAILSASGAETLLEVDDQMHAAELGPMARVEAPRFLQLCGLVRDDNRQEGGKRLFNIQMEIERAMPEAHVCSLSLDSVIYKLRGTRTCSSGSIRTSEPFSKSSSPWAQPLLHQHPAHGRTRPALSLLGHNGEINTIEKLRSSARALGIIPTPGGSDSQDLNRILEG
jgi:Glutamate synthase domain 1